MSEVSIFETGLPDAADLPVSPLSKAGRTMAKADAATTIAARNDYNKARLQMHRTHLNTAIQKAEIESRAELAQHTMYKVTEVHQTAIALAAGNPSLAMTLAEIQAAYNTAEVSRIIKRGF